MRFNTEHSKKILRYSLFLPGKFVLQFSWCRTPGELWYSEKPGDRPFLWAGKYLSDDSVIFSACAGRLAVGIGFKRRKNKGDNKGGCL
jgi:hypothetical protein